MAFPPFIPTLSPYSRSVNSTFKVCPSSISNCLSLFLCPLTSLKLRTFLFHGFSKISDVRKDVYRCPNFLYLENWKEKFDNSGEVIECFLERRSKMLSKKAKNVQILMFLLVFMSYVFICCMDTCMFICVWTHAEDKVQLLGLILPFNHVSPGIELRATGLVTSATKPSYWSQKQIFWNGLADLKKKCYLFICSKIGFVFFTLVNCKKKNSVKICRPMDRFPSQPWDSCLNNSR